MSQMNYGTLKMESGPIPASAAGRQKKAPNASLVGILDEMIENGMENSRTITLPGAAEDRVFRRDLIRAAKHLGVYHSVRPIESPAKDDDSRTARQVTFWVREKARSGRRAQSPAEDEYESQEWDD